MTTTIDKTAPKLISNLPVTINNVGQNLVFTFNESIKVGTGNIVIQHGKVKQTIPISDPQITIDGATLTINPTSDFLANTHYTVQLPKTAITDLTGNKFAGITQVFDTDTIAPTIKTHTPASNKKSVATNSNVTFTFSEKIQAGDGNVVLKDDLGNELKIPISSPEITIKGSTLTVNPSKNLDGNTLYTVSLDAGAVKDLANNSIGNSGSFAFTTKNVVDKIAPLLNTLSPSDNATTVAVNSDLKLTFNETIKAGTGNIIISNGTDTRTISITDTTQVSHDFNVLTINPKSDLLPGTTYSVTFAAGVITDKTGNAFAGITDTSKFNFSTAPQITGKIVDGYIKGATVFADANNDGILEKATESWTTSDGNGNFVLNNPVGSIVMLGDGVDIVTGKAFTQIMKAPAGSTVVTPATTVMQSLIETGKTEAEAQVLTLQALGLPATTNLKTSDPIANLNNATTAEEKTIAAKALSASVQLANAYLSGGSATLDALTSRINKGDSTSVDLTSKTVLESLGVATANVEQIANSNTNINNATADELSSTIQTELAISKATIAYSATTFVEAAANDGSISTAVTLTLTGDKFSGAIDTPLSSVTVANAPDGLTPVITKTSDTTAILTLTGKATAHLNSNDLNNLTVTLGDASFTDVKAMNVTGATKSKFNIDFADQPVLTYSTKTFTEALANDGSITTAINLSLANGVFSGANGSLLSGVSIPNLPTGLSAVVTKNTDTTATLTLTGNATNHLNANDLSNLTVTLSDASFVTVKAANITGASTSGFNIDFTDQPVLTYSTKTFTEALANDGSITTAINLSLANGVFSGANGSLLSGISIPNLPTGLSAVVTKNTDTTATLTLTGNATNHLNANDLSNLTVTLSDASFVTVKAANITGVSTSGFNIDFTDQPVLTYSTTTFTEAAANNGSIATAITLSLTGDSFADSLSSSVNFSGVPAGLTAHLTKTDSTHATLTLTGNATSHETSINNLIMTLGSSSFANTKGAVTDSTKTFSIDFTPATITPTPTPTPTDTTPPSISTAAVMITNTSSISVTSTESGTAYLVNSKLTQPVSLSALTSLEASNDTSVNHISIVANTPTNLAASGLVNGTYKVYAVDAAGNLSTAASNLITIGTSLDSLPNNANQSNPLVLNASATTLALFDSVATSDYVRVTGFGADDSIYIPDLGTNHLVIESNGADVTFTVNNSGTVSQITLVGVNVNNDVITDVASFNALSVGNILFPIA